MPVAGLVGAVIALCSALFISLVLYVCFHDQVWAFMWHKAGVELERYNKARRPRRLILIRHGESLANVDDTVYARVADNRIPLTDKGKQQASEAGRKLAQLVGNESVTFFVSPFRRTRQTFREIVAHLAPGTWKAIEEPRIREQEWGNFQDPTHMPNAFKERNLVGRFFYRFPSGESGADVYDRVSGFLETLFRNFEHRDVSQNFVIVTHGLFIRLFLMRYYKYSVNKFERISNFKNCEMVVMEMKDSCYCLTTPLSFDDGTDADDDDLAASALHAGTEDTDDQLSQAVGQQ